MNLPTAIRKSDCRAAILPLPEKQWSFVIVEWERHVYTGETHVYYPNGDIYVRIICYSRMNEDGLKTNLKERYYSNDWEPFNRDTTNQVVELEARNLSPRRTKKMRLPIPDEEWEMFFK